VAKLLRRLLIVALATFGALLYGGPLISGGFWLTSPASSDRTPVAAPWQAPYHRGGIDFATGLYVRTDEDLVVHGGDLPIVLRRTYRSEDQVSRAFGVGTSHNGEWFLHGDGARFQWVELILEDGGRVRYERISPGSSFPNAMFEHTETPTDFYGSRIGWTGWEWALRWFDGSVGIFRACSRTGSDRCAIVEMRNPAGLQVEYLRDDGQVLRTIRSGKAEVELDYDDERRVVRVYDGGQQEVRYAYDAGGRLARVTEMTGVVRTYTYDSRGAMLSINEPRWHLENTYDEGGRCVRQVTRLPDGRTSAIDVAYQVKDGAVVEASSAWNGGPRTVYRFNKQQFMESKEMDPTGPAPILISYHRNAFSNVSTRVSVRCYDAERRLLRKAEGEYEGDEAADELALATCGAPAAR